MDFVSKDVELVRVDTGSRLIEGFLRSMQVERRTERDGPRGRRIKIARGSHSELQGTRCSI